MCGGQLDLGSQQNTSVLGTVSGSRSVVSDSATPWTGPCQAPLSMEFSGQEYWSGLSFPSPGDLPDPGIKLESLTFSAMASGFFTTSTTCGLPSMGSHRVRHD